MEKLTKIMAGLYTYKGFTLVKVDTTRTRIAGPTIQWKLFRGDQLTGKYLGNWRTLKQAKRWIDAYPR